MNEMSNAVAVIFCSYKEDRNIRKHHIRKQSIYAEATNLSRSGHITGKKEFKSM
jgi:hypothetical protein